MKKWEKPEIEDSKSRTEMTVVQNVVFAATFLWSMLVMENDDDDEDEDDEEEDDAATRSACLSLFEIKWTFDKFLEKTEIDSWVKLLNTKDEKLLIMGENDDEEEVSEGSDEE